MPVAFVKSSISGARTLVTSDQSKLTTFSPLAVGPRPHEPSRPFARAAPLAIPMTRRKVRRLRGSIAGLPSLSEHYHDCKGALRLNAVGIILYENATPSPLQEGHPMWQQACTTFHQI